MLSDWLFVSPPQLANASLRRTNQMMESKARLHAGSRAPRRKVESLIYLVSFPDLLKKEGRVPY